MHSFSSAIVALLALSPQLVIAEVPIKALSCKSTTKICQNICYYLTCAHPYDGTNARPDILTRQINSQHPGAAGQRRIDCGADHSPAPFTTKANGGLALPKFGPSPDEYPFASSLEGGRTRYGDGAGLLGVLGAEQDKQASRVSGFWAKSPATGDGEQTRVMLTDTAGIPYCDDAATNVSPFCDGSQFRGLHFDNANNRYCQWSVETANAKCYDGATGNEVASAKRRDVEKNEQGVPLAYYEMLHVQYPDMAAAMWDEDVHGPMPAGYVPITSVEQWLEMNRTAMVMPPKLFGRAV